MKNIKLLPEHFIIIALMLYIIIYLSSKEYRYQVINEGQAVFDKKEGILYTKEGNINYINNTITKKTSKVIN